MCGIAGKLNFAADHPVAREEVAVMLGVMRHRGPDGDGIHLDGPCGLGHLRLSIIDLSTGAQPLSNEDGSVWISFNGEIYNYRELRRDLESAGHQFRTQSDTEVIVHLFEEYGSGCVERLQGMFAFAIWDATHRRLFLARDRVGIKPLYYEVGPGAFAFASEIKALLADRELLPEIDPAAIDAFWSFNYLPGEQTMYRRIRKLLPGHWISADIEGRIQIQQYWDLHFRAGEFRGDLADASEQLSALLKQTIRSHMISDVPVGFLLSGGMDSSAVLAYAASETDKEISTFTVGFANGNVPDERPYARLMAERFRTRHFETSFSADDFWNHLPSLLWHLEEPVCEPPAVALHYVSRLARSHVKVLLSGEGGDEAFGGYPNYVHQGRLDRIRRLLGPLRPIAARGAAALGNLLRKPRWTDHARLLPLELPAYYWSRVGSPFFRDPRHGIARYTAGFAAMVDGGDPGEFVRELFSRVEGQPVLNQMLYVDTKTWLPDDLLVKADKVTMANSLELRVPLLDHKVLEFAASLPIAFKVRGGETKRVLRTAFAKVLPREILERKKAGFPIPYARWLANELWSRTRDALTASDSFVGRHFSPPSVLALLEAHRRSGGLQRQVFALVALEMWHSRFGCHRPAVSQAVAA